MLTKDNKILISIIIPSLNRYQFLKEAISSVLCQITSHPVELIVVDNCSDDETENYMSSLAHPQLQYYRNTVRLNICDNWQKGLSLSKGQYFLVLGDDDALFPNWVNEVIRLISIYEEISFLSWNHIAFTKKNPVLGWNNLVVYPKSIDGDVIEISPSLVRKHYLGQGSSLKFQPHPSLFLFNRRMVDNVVEKYGIEWFGGEVFPDYHAAVLLGNIETNGLYINKPLVCIGGVEEKFYCKKLSKMDGFLITNSKVARDLNVSPYMVVNIAKQLKATTQLIDINFCEHQYVEKMMNSLLENIVFCESQCGKGSHINDKAILEKKYGKKVVNRAFCKALYIKFRNFLNRSFISVFGQEIAIKYRNIVSKSDLVYDCFPDAKNINAVISGYLTR